MPGDCFSSATPTHLPQPGAKRHKKLAGAEPAPGIVQKQRQPVRAGALRIRCRKVLVGIENLEPAARNIGEEVAAAAEEKGKLDPEKISKRIGVSASTFISLALALHRQGKLKIRSLEVEPGDNVNTEICGCLK